MSLVDDLKSGYKGGTWNQSPIYPNAVWTAKVTLTGTPSIEGLTFECYARANEFSKERLFEVEVVDALESGNVVLYLKGAELETAKAAGCSDVLLTLQFTEDANNETYTYFHGSIFVESGVL